MVNTSYLRFPHVSRDLLTFIAEDDVWLAPADGGRATRLTSDRVPVSSPRLSPDGRHVAWTSSRDGTNEAYVVAVDGGPVIRLTHWGDAGATTVGWISDTEVLVRSSTGQHSFWRTWMYAVSLDGATRALPYGPAAALSLAPGAALLGSLYYSDPAWWKRYGGGTGGRIWLDRDGNGEFAHILSEVGNHLVDPMFVGERIAFLSDHEGHGALYSTERDESDLRRHTPVGPYYARHASTDGTRVVYQSAGEIWLLASLDAEPVKLELSLGGVRSGREPFPVEAKTSLGAFSLDETGRVLAAEVRGTVHWLPAEDGPARTLLATPGVRGGLPVVVAGKSAVLCSSDAGGENGLDLIPADGSPTRRIGHGRIGAVMDLAVSPDGRTAAVASDDGRLLLVDLDADSPDAPDGTTITELARVELQFARDLVFSADSSCLAWTEVWSGDRGDHLDSQIRLARLTDRLIVDVTGARFDSHSPVFSADGKYLSFLSNRTFDPSYDAHLFDLGFLPGVRLYLVTLAQETPSPFAPELDGRPVTAHDGKDEDKKDESGKSNGDTPAQAPVRLDPIGLAKRIVPYPIEAGDYTRLSAVKGGVVWLNRPTRGELGETWKGAAEQPPKAVLTRYDLGKRKRSVAVAALDSYAVSGDGGRIAYRTDGQTGGELKIKDSDASDEENTITVDLDRIRVQVDPTAEWSQMYHESWRLIRDNFWRSDLFGFDWPAMADKYRPVLDRIGSHDDLVDLLWELAGELGSSHVYVLPKSPDKPEAKRQGLLGADLAVDADGTWRISRIVPGESSVIDGRSPLEAPGVVAGPGDAIVAVDGRLVDPVRGPAPLLAGKANKPVELTLRRSGQDSSDPSDPAAFTERRVVVVPLASERTLRYQDTIAARRAKVRELSGGRLGYVHVPDMMSAGWAEFHRDFTIEVAHEGLLVDVRANSGGHTSGLVVEKLTRKIIAWDFSRRGKPVSYPLDAPRGPVVTLTDEWAGSDGDIVTQAIKTYDVGPVVGTRTWGGVLGYDYPRELVDGTFVTQANLGFFFDGDGSEAENYGVDPDVEVRIAPQDWAAGRDPQLEKAVRMALEALESQPAAAPRAR